MNGFLEKYVALRDVPPFCDISANDVATIADACFFHEFAPSKQIVFAGDLPTHLFIAVSGGICDKDEKSFGKIFGARNLVSNEPYTSGAFADLKNGAKCLVLSRGHFLSAVKNCPSILVGLLKIESGEETQK